jgi:hypothetical protein
MRLYTDHFAFGARVTPRLRAAGFRARGRRNHNHPAARNVITKSAASRCVMSAERAHDHRRPPATHAIPGVCATSHAGITGIENTCSYVRTKPYKPHYCPRLNPPPDDRGKVDDSPRSRSTRAAPEHTHSVQATKLRRWQYRYMWYGPPYHLFTCPIDCTSLIRS